MKIKRTDRGFPYVEFKDTYESDIYIQKSSVADYDAIWLGIRDPKPQVKARDAAKVGVKTNETVGWVPFPIPDEVNIIRQMHINKKQAKKIVKMLNRFIETGDIV